jgi:hypothetical protein
MLAVWKGGERTVRISLTPFALCYVLGRRASWCMPALCISLAVIV